MTFDLRRSALVLAALAVVGAASAAVIEGISSKSGDPGGTPQTAALPAGELEAMAATQVAYYVDFNKGSDSNNGLSATTPFKTLNKARTVVDGVNNAMSGDIIVYLRGGHHTLTAPLSFGTNDGGSNGHSVIYRAHGTTERPVVSGGLNVSGTWSDANADGIWEATVPVGTQSRNLYVAGAPATLARSATVLPNVTITSTGLTTSNLALSGYANESQIEFVWLKDWKVKTFSAASIADNGTTTTVTMKQPGWGLRDGGFQGIGEAPSYYQNALELLNQPGEWYLSPSLGRLYYMPRPGEAMGSVEAVLATVDTGMIRVMGTSTAPVRNLRFENIGFAHSTYMRPQSAQGHAGQQSNATRNTLLGADYTTASDAAVHLRFSDNVAFVGCDFRNHGASGLWLDKGAKNTDVIGNTFANLGSNGIQVGWMQRSVSLGDTCTGCADVPLAEEVTGNLISNNHIYATGVEFTNAAQGIHLAMVKNTDVVHNTVHRQGYTAIALGYNWNDTVTDSGNVRITHNRIYNFLKQGRDGGGIYTLGYQGATGATLISDNHIYNMQADYGGLYTDQGSSSITMERNVVEQMNGKRWYHNNAFSGGAQTALLIRNNFSDTSTASAGPPSGITGHTVYAPGSAPAAAAAIKSASGLEAGFASLLSYRPAYQAEFASVGGGTAFPPFSGFGYNGTNVADFSPSGGYVDFTVTMTAAGSGTMAVRYAQSVTTNRTVNLVINGVTQPFTFVPTGGTSNWGIINVPITLNAGVNTIRFISTGQDGGALDQIELVGFPN